MMSYKKREKALKGGKKRNIQKVLSKIDLWLSLMHKKCKYYRNLKRAKVARFSYISLRNFELTFSKLITKNVKSNII